MVVKKFETLNILGCSRGEIAHVDIESSSVTRVVVEEHEVITGDQNNNVFIFFRKGILIFFTDNNSEFKPVRTVLT